MILAVAATEFEMLPFITAADEVTYRSLISGVGPVESCLQLTRYLEKCREISMVVNFGVAGAYRVNNAQVPDLLDICLAETEVFGDFGICFPRRIDTLPEEFSPKRFTLDKGLLLSAEEILTGYGSSYVSGNFITVNCASGTKDRGDLLRDTYNGVCENMEGAALARVCDDFDLPLLQVRCISNYVEDRDPSKWRLLQACEKSGRTAAYLVQRLG